MRKDRTKLQINRQLRRRTMLDQIRPHGLTSPTYWFMMQIGMVLGFIASFPANWYLVRAGVKPGM